MTGSSVSESKATALLFVAAIAAPLVMLLGMGFISYQQIKSDAGLRVGRTAQAVAEHALRTFRAHDLIITAVGRYVDGWDWPRISGSRPLHDFLAKVAEDAPDISTVFIIGPTGREGNSSLKFPLAPIDLSGGSVFKAAQASNELIISSVLTGRLNQDRPYFGFARRRPSPPGVFDGVINVSVDPDYFSAFYRQLIETPQDAVALVRADGQVLVRYPPIDPTRARMGSGLLGAIARNPEAGVYSIQSPVDDIYRLISYRKVGDYPIYVSYALSYAAIWAAWRNTMYPYAAICLLAMGLLWTAAIIARRGARREQLAAAQVADEIARRAAAEDASRAKDEFLAALSHELRNPLSAIANGAEILRRLHGADSRSQTALGIVSRQMSHLKRLLGDLLDVARTGYGKTELELATVDATQTARDIIADSAAEGRGDSHIEVSGGAVLVSADPSRLRQMLENLLDNAVKYGGRHIIIRVSADAGMAKIAVQDDGPGITPELLPRLFDPFVQGSAAVERARGGLGLGLSLVKRFAELHGGAVTVSSGAGGSTFTIQLPLAPAPAPRETALAEDSLP